MALLTPSSTHTRFADHRVSPAATLGDVLRVFLASRTTKKKCTCVAVVDDDNGKLLGIASETDVLAAALRARAHERPASAVRVAEFCRRRQDIAALDIKDYFAYGGEVVAGVLAERRIKHLPVVDAEDRSLGIIDCFDACSDLTRRMHVDDEEARSRLEALVRSRRAGDAAATCVFVPQDAGIWAVARQMLAQKLTMLFIEEIVGANRSVAGIVTLSDVLKAICQADYTTWAMGHLASPTIDSIMVPRERICFRDPDEFDASEIMTTMMSRGFRHMAFLREHDVGVLHLIVQVWRAAATAATWLEPVFQLDILDVMTVLTPEDARCRARIVPLQLHAVREHADSVSESAAGGEENDSLHDGDHDNRSIPSASSSSTMNVGVYFRVSKLQLSQLRRLQRTSKTLLQSVSTATSQESLREEFQRNVDAVTSGMRSCEVATAGPQLVECVFAYCALEVIAQTWLQLHASRANVDDGDSDAAAACEMKLRQVSMLSKLLSCSMVPADEFGMPAAGTALHPGTHVSFTADGDADIASPGAPGRAGPVSVIVGNPFSFIASIAREWISPAIHACVAARAVDASSPDERQPTESPSVDNAALSETIRRMIRYILPMIRPLQVPLLACIGSRHEWAAAARATLEALAGMQVSLSSSVRSAAESVLGSSGHEFALGCAMKRGYAQMYSTRETVTAFRKLSAELAPLMHVVSQTRQLKNLVGPCTENTAREETLLPEQLLSRLHACECTLYAVQIALAVEGDATLSPLAPVLALSTDPTPTLVEATAAACARAWSATKSTLACATRQLDSIRDVTLQLSACIATLPGGTRAALASVLPATARLLAVIDFVSVAVACLKPGGRAAPACAPLMRALVQRSAAWSLTVCACNDEGDIPRVLQHFSRAFLTELSDAPEDAPTENKVSSILAPSHAGMNIAASGITASCSVAASSVTENDLDAMFAAIQAQAALAGKTL